VNERAFRRTVAVLWTSHVRNLVLVNLNRWTHLGCILLSEYVQTIFTSDEKRVIWRLTNHFGVHLFVAEFHLGLLDFVLAGLLSFALFCHSNPYVVPSLWPRYAIFIFQLLQSSKKEPILCLRRVRKSTGRMNLQIVWVSDINSTQLNSMLFCWYCSDEERTIAQNIPISSREFNVYIYRALFRLVDE
jgi:hypothetical protein